MHKRIFFPLVSALALIFSPFLAEAQDYSGWRGSSSIPISGPPEIIFPVQGGATFTDDFGDARSAHVHEGNDLMAPKMTPIIAARGGTVVFAPTTEPSYGYMLTVSGDDGYKYNYIHINNDTPGTDDGAGGVANAYAPGIAVGKKVVQGQHIAWVGDSGNAESVGSHLHFEIRLADNTAINPYSYLQAALGVSSYDAAAAKAASPTINADKGLIAIVNAPCSSGTLVKTPEFSSVYYCGADGKRYVFPNANTYATWYDDFSSVITIAPEALAAIPLGGNVTYRPGVRLIKIQTDPKVYAVDHDGTLRWVTSSAVAEKYYGASWAKSVDDVPDTFFINYVIGDAINT